MRIVVDTPLISYWPSTDWMAYDAHEFPDGPVAYGKSPKDALTELASIYDNDDNAVAVIEAKIEELTAVVGVPV